jgi:hypothetical protein
MPFCHRRSTAPVSQLLMTVDVTVAVDAFDVTPASTADAVFVMDRASMLACTTCGLVQLVAAAGAATMVPHANVPSLLLRWSTTAERHVAAVMTA